MTSFPVHISCLVYMAFCCYPTLLQKIASDLVAIRSGGESDDEQKRRKREENKEKLSLVQLVSLGKVGKEEVKSEREMEGSEGRSKGESFKEKANDIVECQSR